MPPHRVEVVAFEVVVAAAVDTGGAVEVGGGADFEEDAERERV